MLICIRIYCQINFEVKTNLQNESIHIDNINLKDIILVNLNQNVEFKSKDVTMAEFMYFRFDITNISKSICNRLFILLKNLQEI